MKAEELRQLYEEETGNVINEWNIDDWYAQWLESKLTQPSEGERMIRVYIASPYTLGDVAVNVKRQLDAVDKLMDKGFAPFAPLYSHFQHMAHPRPYQDWINIDLEWVQVCDCVLRLDGKSSGADGEVSLAKHLNIPVYYSFNELFDAFNTPTKKGE